ncbi:hypothetical protein FGG08_007311 [Glutinoglossum americanum]|uniref:Uncharacterized protein n=1 Tax=Glutinoglossum americanum TaxID=1670608 RepID=A0A9P8HWL5_9PEZI|nr:hypothetical protein FGG08_007311 [Glutinoglossum americanum]
MAHRSSRHQISGAVHRIEPPTSKRAFLERETRQADGSVEMPTPRVVPAGWRGKRPSRDKYAEFGSKNGLDKNFTPGFGGRDDGQDKGKAMNENKENGKGNDGNDGNDGDPTESNAKGTVAPKPKPDEENLDGCSDDDLANFKAPVFREAKSLFSHSYEEELRKRMKIVESIDADFRLTGDSIARAERVAKEQRRQRSWTEEYEYSNALEKARATRTQGVTKESSCDSPVDCWVWRLTEQVVGGTDIPVFRRVYLWKSAILGDQMIWESDILQIPIAKLRRCGQGYEWYMPYRYFDEYFRGDISTWRKGPSGRWQFKQVNDGIRIWGT